MENVDVDVAEEAMIALASGSVLLVCMRTEKETADIVTFLRREGFVTSGTATAQEMLDRTIARHPDLLIIAHEVASIDGSHLVRKVREISWPYDYGESGGPAIISLVPDEPRPRRELFVGSGHYPGADMTLSYPCNKQELLVFTKRILKSLHADDGRYRL